MIIHVLTSLVLGTGFEAVFLVFPKEMGPLFITSCWLKCFQLFYYNTWIHYSRNLCMFCEADAVGNLQVFKMFSIPFLKRNFGKFCLCSLSEKEHVMGPQSLLLCCSSASPSCSHSSATLIPELSHRQASEGDGWTALLGAQLTAPFFSLFREKQLLEGELIFISPQADGSRIDIKGDSARGKEWGWKEQGCEDGAWKIRSKSIEESKKRLRDHRKKANFKDGMCGVMRVKKKRPWVIRQEDLKREERGGKKAEVVGVIM